jgi:hypothetical protein
VPASEPDPGPETRLQRLRQEWAEVEDQLVALRAARERKLHDDADVTDIEALDRERGRFELRREQIGRLLPGALEEVRQLNEARRADYWAKTYCPDLGEAERRLGAAVEELGAALSGAREMHGRVCRAGFSAELHRDFVPLPVLTTGFCLATYLQSVQQRQAAPTRDAGAHDGSFIVEAVTGAIPPSTPPFRPRVVPQSVINAEPLFGVRMVKISHTVRTRIPGYARLLAGQELALPARWAAMVTHSGVGVEITGTAAQGTPQ